MSLRIFQELLFPFFSTLLARPLSLPLFCTLGVNEIPLEFCIKPRKMFYPSTWHHEVVASKKKVCRERKNVDGVSPAKQLDLNLNHIMSVTAWSIIQ